MEGGHSPEAPQKKPLKERVKRTVRNTVAALGIAKATYIDEQKPVVDVQTTHTGVLNDKGEISSSYETKRYFDSETRRELDPNNPQDLKIIKERLKVE